MHHATVEKRRNQYRIHCNNGKEERKHSRGAQTHKLNIVLHSHPTFAVSMDNKHKIIGIVIVKSLLVISGGTL